MADIFIYKYLVCFVCLEQLNCLLMSYYTIYTLAYLENSPAPLEIRTRDLVHSAIPCDTKTPTDAYCLHMLVVYI